MTNEIVMFGSSANEYFALYSLPRVHACVEGGCLVKTGGEIIRKCLLKLLAAPCTSAWPCPALPSVLRQQASHCQPTL